MDVMSRHVVRPTFATRRRQTRRGCHRDLVGHLRSSCRTLQQLCCIAPMSSASALALFMQNPLRFLCPSTTCRLFRAYSISAPVERCSGAGLWPVLMLSTRHALPWLRVPDGPSICTSILLLHAELMLVAFRSPTLSGQNIRQHINLWVLAPK